VKRTLKGSADVDLRGRVRREEEEPMRIVKIRLVGGPAGAGIDLDVPDPGDFLNYGGWKWAEAVREEAHVSGGVAGCPSHHRPHRA
jgi:hypothetical protein